MIGIGKMWKAVTGRDADAPPISLSTIPRDLGSLKVSPADPLWEDDEAEPSETRSAQRFVPLRTTTLLNSASGRRMSARIINISRTGSRSKRIFASSAPKRSWWSARGRSLPAVASLSAPSSCSRNRSTRNSATPRSSFRTRARRFRLDSVIPATHLGSPPCHVGRTDPTGSPDDHVLLQHGAESAEGRPVPRRAGLDYEAVPVDSRKGEQHADAYRAINPTARCPPLSTGTPPSSIRTPSSSTSPRRPANSCRAGRQGTGRDALVADVRRDRHRPLFGAGRAFQALLAEAAGLRDPALPVRGRAALGHPGRSPREAALHAGETYTIVGHGGVGLGPHGAVR